MSIEKRQPRQEVAPKFSPVRHSTELPHKRSYCNIDVTSYSTSHRPGALPWEAPIAEIPFSHQEGPLD